MLATAAAVPTAQLDRDNPWPGLESFTEDARDYFHGREAETDELLRRVADAPLTVLFGKSGLGKTSLLKAGLFPRLREKHFLPVHVRLDVRMEAPELADQLRDALLAEIERERVDAPPFAAGETLWEYLHRADLELWSGQNHLLTPVFVLDQFEEVFTLGERLPEAVAQCKIDLGDLAENRIPAALADRLAADAWTAQRLDLRRMAYKMVVTLREDFLPHLEGWRVAVPSLGRVRVRLLPMRPEQALSAVHDSAPHLMDEPLARRIVGFVAAAQSDGGAQEASTGGEIEPALLSLFCRGLNEQRKRQGKDRFDEQLLEGAQQSIIADYYRSCVECLPDSASRFIETDLITEKGFRNSYAKDDAVPALVTQEQLDRLINRRLLRLEERYGTARIELTHDLLTRAVMAHRDRRRLEEEKTALEAQARTQRRRVFTLAVIALVCLAFAGAAAWQWREAVTAKTAAENEALKALDAQLSSLSAKLASDSRVERDRDRNLALSYLLAAAAWSAKPTLEARNVLLSSLLEKPALRGMLPVPNIVSAVAFSPDGRTLASEVVGVVFWDVARHTPLGMPLRKHRRTVTSLAFSPDGKILATGSWDGGLFLSDVSRRDGEWLGQHEGPVWSVAFSPDGRTLASASPAGAATLWDVASRKEIGRPLAERKLGIGGVAFSPDGNTLALSSDKTILFWDVPGGRAVGKPLVGHQKLIWSMAFSPDGRTLASGSADKTILLWDVASRSALGKPFAGHKGAVKSVAFSRDGTLASGSEDGTILFWDVVGRSPLGEPLDGHTGSVLSVAFSPDGKALAAGTLKSSILLWDVAGRTELAKSLAGPGGPIASAAFSPDGRTLAAGTPEETIFLWDVVGRRRLGEPLAGHRGLGQVIAFSPDGKGLATRSDEVILLWDTSSRRPVGELPAEQGRDIRSLAFSPDGKSLAVGSKAGSVVLWDITRQAPLGEPLRSGKAFRGGVLSLAFSPDGTLLAAGRRDGSIDLWDVVRRASLGEPLGSHEMWLHEEPVQSVSFSPDGQTLASGRADGTVLLWDVARRTRIGEKLAGHKEGVQSVRFSQDGKTLVSASENGSLLLWDVDPGSWSRRACFIASRNFTCDEWRRYFLDEPYRKICAEFPDPEKSCD